MTALLRARIALLASAFVVLGAAACGIFDSFEWALIVTPLLPALTVGFLARRRLSLRVLGAVAAVAAATAVAVVSVGGTRADFAAAFGAGPQRLLSTEWPSPVRGDLVGTVAGWLSAMTAGAALLATGRRWHLLPLSPVAITYVCVVALSSPLGARPLVLVALCAICILYATLRTDGTFRDRWLLLSGERRLLGLLAIAGLVAFAVSIPTSFASRADPRRDDPAQETAALLDPIEATIALRRLEPPIDLHGITATDGTVELPARWRTAALEEYDGKRWTPVLTIRPIGNTLGPATGETISADITFLDDDLSLVPLPGAPVSVDVPVETDRERTVVLLAERPEPGDSVGIVSNVAVTLESIGVGASVRPRPVDEDVAGLTGLAESLTDGGASLLEQLTTIEQTMRDEFVLESAASGGGMQRTLIDRFLRDTQRGNTEQFTTAFVLLARSLGADARVATGFVADAPSPGALMLTSSDAIIWPEVAMADGTWIAFDPVPPEESTDPTPPDPEPQVQTPAAPQPPVAEPPESDTETSNDDDQATEVETDVLSTAALWATRVGVAGVVVLLPAIAAVGAVLGIKYQRRRRRQRDQDPAVRIRGAWASATDVLVDAGMAIPLSATDDEIARQADPIAPRAQRELRRLARLSSAATYGAPKRPDLLAQDALNCLGVIDAAIAAPRTRWQRIRWRLSLRSLRQTTRSPVRL